MSNLISTRFEIKVNIKNRNNVDIRFSYTHFPIESWDAINMFTDDMGDLVEFNRPSEHTKIGN